MADFPVALTNAQDGPPGVGTPLMAKHLNNLEAKVGIDASAVPTSLDYLLRNPASIEPGHKHSKLWSPDGSLQALTVAAAGRVGIGTASPLAVCDVVGVLRAQAAPENVPSGGTGVEILYDSNAALGWLVAYDRTGGAWKPIKIGGSVITLQANGVEALSVTGGKVGIGTVAPDVKLGVQISDTSTVAAWPGTWQAQAYDALALYNQSGAAQITSLFFRNYNTGDGVAYHAGRIGLLRRGSGSADFAFMLRNGGSIYNEVLRLTGPGNVGIGTMSPGKKLDVAGYARAIGIFNTLNSAPADGDLAAGECALWFDKTDGAAKLMFKAKQANGTVVTGFVSLS